MCQQSDNKALKITGDGSHTLYISDLNEGYHSSHGAIQEAKHVYLDAGFNYFKNKDFVRVLEMGFGTGLNAFLTYLASLTTAQKVVYTGIEVSPLSLDWIHGLNYMQQLEAEKEHGEIFLQMHTCPWEKEVELTKLFSLRKIARKLENLTIREVFDVIYFDAFGPRVQPELWTAEVFEKMYDLLDRGGVLVTYCAKGSVKRTLKEVGFQLESLPGPKGKREMTRAIK